MFEDQRRELRLHARRKVDALQPFEHLLTGEVIIHLIIERQDDVRETELGVREHPHRVRQTAEAYLQRNRHLLLDLLRRVPWHQRDDRHLHIGDVRKRLDRQRPERLEAGADEQHREQEQEKRLMKGNGNNACEHTQR